jgi:predicted phage terminase large subunit-like protein
LGGDIFIIDDPQKAVDALSDASRNWLNQWYSNTLISRLDNKRKGAIIVVTQRMHMDDLTAHALRTSKHWEVLSIPAIADLDEDILIRDENEEADYYHRSAGEALQPDREPADMLRELELADPYTFAAQYQQSPVPIGGLLIQREWLRYYTRAELPERTYKSKIIQSWDTAAKNGTSNDYSVCTTWLVHDKIYYLLDLLRGRYDYPQLRELAVKLAQQYKPDVVLIEDTCVGSALCRELGDLIKKPIKPVPVHGNKTGRLFVEQGKFQAGLVRFPKDATFLRELEAELLAFPQGKHDDQVDSITQALSYEIRTYDPTMPGLNRLYEGLIFEPMLRAMLDAKGRR